MSGSSGADADRRFLSVRVESVALAYGGVENDPGILAQICKRLKMCVCVSTSTANGGLGEVKVEGKQPPQKIRSLEERCAGKNSKFVGRTMQDERRNGSEILCQT